MTDSTLWYLARGTGIVTVILLSANVALGILHTMRWSAPSWPRFMSQYLHRNVSLLAISFLAVHIVTTVVDAVSPVRLVNAIVPFSGTYRPVGVGLGAVACDLLAALVVTSLLRLRIGHTVWRAVHWTAYACWPFAMLHALIAGTDAATIWARAIYVACGALVVAAVGWRVAAVFPPAAAPAPAPARAPRRAPFEGAHR
jgi:methionine sulfoxide reductase heme-binding subunit